MKRLRPVRPPRSDRHRLYRRIALWTSLLLGATLTAVAESPDVHTIAVAKDVYAVIAKPGPLGEWGLSNSAFIVNQNDVVVVDTQMRPSLAAEVIAEIRKITNKPVRYVINTHWHRDHVQGNQSYVDAFGPGLTIIQQKNAREDQIANQSAELKARAPSEVSSLEALLASDKDEKGAPLDTVSRSRLTTLLAARKVYLSEVPKIRPTPGTLTFSDKVTLYEGDREIDLYYFGYAHTRGDLVVYLPAEKVVITGDMVQAGVPDTRHSYPLEWSDTLKSLKAFEWKINIPGHGNVQENQEVLDRFMAYLNAVILTVKDGIAKNMSVDQMTAMVDPNKYFVTPNGFIAGPQNVTQKERSDLAVRRIYEELTARGK